MDTRLLPGNTRKERRHNAAVAVTMSAIAAQAQQDVAALGNLTPAEESLVQYMAMMGGMVEMNARPGALYPQGYYQLVRQNGRLWEAQALPAEYKRMTVKECFSNAMHLALDDPDLTYVEGYAQSPMIPTNHAWVVDRDGYVIDPTWDSPETNGYFGIAFDTEFALRLVEQQGYYGLLGNDWLNKTQMLTHGLVMDVNDQGHEVAIGIGEE
jgi:hypothetical protein